MRNIIRILLSGLLFVPFASTFATINAGTVTAPGGITNVAYNKPSSVAIRWRLTRVGGGTPAAQAGTVVSSSEATFTNIGGGTLLGTATKSISKTDTPDASGGTDFVTINETIIVPRSVVFKAYQAGLKQISYNRAFTDCPGTTCGNVAGTIRMTLNLSGSGGTATGISSYKLRFEDDSIHKTIEHDGVLHAVATMYSTRTDLIRGVWEVATSSTSVGEPVYKTFQLVSKQVTGGVPTQIRSKQLPTNEYGLHLIRFRLLKPELADEDPVLQYMVTQGSERTPLVMDIFRPSSGRKVGSDTIFQWQPLAHATAYKIEFVDSEPLDSMVKQGTTPKPVVGMIMQTINNAVVLPDNSWSRLQSGKHYWWQITAIDKKGRTIGQSRWQEVVIQ
ncbi:MAG: hypothetical protein OEW89_09770 [Gammaproteobacteria bacterium]|nr:hypothetical protein [Gammaproteobacteria bacterium]MDH5593792.1 hypothetical protein [Gammaproteobacteria bacterium]MDH5613518.1 hypothetical protein [Gammaproteobacteria bacterium]